MIQAAIVALFLGLTSPQSTNRMTSVVLAQETPTWVTKRYHVLEDGNDLYAQCQNAEKSIRTEEGDNIRVIASGDLFSAGTCWGYIQAVVDSVPAGEGFEPDENVRLTQYMDVVLAYLRDNPSLRHHPAYFLTRTALSNAFPAKAGKVKK